MRSELGVYFTVIILSMPFVLVLCTPELVEARTVGVSKTFIDLGEYQRGTKNIASFELVSSTRESISVSLERSKTNVDVLKMDSHPEYIEEYSEEDVMGWIDIFDSSVQLQELPVDDESIVGAYKKVDFVVDVPIDAEPGYHSFKIKPIPELEDVDTGPVGARVVSITSVTFVFRVAGEVQKTGVILDVVAGPRLGNRFVTEAYYQNTGTNTMTINAIQKLFDPELNEEIGKSDSGKLLIEPGEVKQLKIIYNNLDLEEGVYETNTRVVHLTGEVERDDEIEVTKEQIPEIVEKKELPWIWIIASLIVLIAYIIYRIY